MSRFDYDRSANFSAYHTYQWTAPENSQGVSQLLDQNIRRSVDAQLAEKGLQLVESGGDLRLAYRTAVKKETEFNAYGATPRVFGPGRITTSSIDVGKLTVDMYDPARQQLVWAGVAEKTLDIKKDPEKNYKNLD